MCIYIYTYIHTYMPCYEAPGAVSNAALMDPPVHRRTIRTTTFLDFLSLF